MMPCTASMNSLDSEGNAVQTIRVCLAGATGWVGKELCLALCSADKFRLVSAVARKSSGRRLGDVLGIQDVDITISKTVTEALATPCDVLVDYTKPDAVFDHVRQAIERGVHVVIGTSGVTEEQFSAIDRMHKLRGSESWPVGTSPLQPFYFRGLR